MMQRLQILAALVAITAASAQEPATTQTRERVVSYFSRYADGIAFSGTVLVAKSGQVLLREARGTTDVATGKPIAIDTRFRLGQLSEAFTAAAIFLMRQQGKLALGDPLSKYLSGFARGDSITIRALLTHDSRLPNVSDVPAFIADPARSHSLPEVIAWLRAGPYPTHRTPASYTFSSPDYTVLAAVIERVSGQPYAAYLRDHVFAPLGMTNTGEDGDPVAQLPLPAVRHYPAGPYVAEHAPPVAWTTFTGSASLYSTVDDLYRFDRALRSGVLLSRASVDEMFATRRGRSAGAWVVSDAGARRSMTINTRAPGVEAGIERYPDDDVCVVLLTNVFSSLSHSAADDLAAVALGDDRISPAPRARVVVPADKLSGYFGRYQLGTDFISGRTIVEVSRTPTGIALVGEIFAWPAHLIPLSDSTFLDRMYGGIVSFTRAPGGQVTGFEWKRSRVYVAARMPAG